MFNNLKKAVAQNKIVVGATSVALGTSSAFGAVTMPVADYTDIEAAATIGFGIAITIGLLMAAKRFFR